MNFIKIIVPYGIYNIIDDYSKTVYIYRSTDLYDEENYINGKFISHHPCTPSLLAHLHSINSDCVEISDFDYDNTFQFKGYSYYQDDFNGDYTSIIPDFVVHNGSKKIVSLNESICFEEDYHSDVIDYFINSINSIKSIESKFEGEYNYNIILVSNNKKLMESNGAIIIADYNCDIEFL